MPRMMGVDIPGKKHIRFALRYIHGIGPKRADDVLAAVKVDPMKKADDVTQDEIGLAEHPPSDPDRVLPRHSPQEGSSRSRTAHEDERPHPQGRQAHLYRDAQAGWPLRSFKK